jgi:hypothetical protein
MTHSNGSRTRRLLAHAVGSVWTCPNTALGLLVGTLGLAVPQLSHGAINFYLRTGPVWRTARRMGVSAFTLGDCIIYLVPPTHNLRVHEFRHVHQYHALGPLFLPAYFLLMALFGYHDHPLETDAYEHERSVCGCVGKSDLRN